jgi:hypothetical protein
MLSLWPPPKTEREGDALACIWSHEAFALPPVRAAWSEQRIITERGCRSQ